MAFPLLAIAASLFPSIVSAVAGDKAGIIAGKVADAARAIVGSDDPAEVAAAIGANPEIAARLREKVIEAELELRRIERDELLAVLADVANARSQTVELARSGSALAWMPAVISFAVLGLAGYIIRMVFQGDFVPEARDLVNMIVGGVAIAGTGQVLNYWLGSTSSSKAKDQSLASALTGRR